MPNHSSIPPETAPPTSHGQLQPAHPSASSSSSSSRANGYQEEEAQGSSGTAADPDQDSTSTSDSDEEYDEATDAFKDEDERIKEKAEKNTPLLLMNPASLPAHKKAEFQERSLLPIGHPMYTDPFGVKIRGQGRNGRVTAKQKDLEIWVIKSMTEASRRSQQ